MTILQRFGRFVVRLLLILIGLLVLALIVVPALPIVRTRVLTIAQNAAEDVGVTFDYDSSGGHLLTGIQLRDVSVVAPGLDATVDDTRVGYNLLGLLRRELPVSVRIAGLTADVDVEDIQIFAEQQFQGDGSGSAPPIRPVIQNVQVDDVSVRVNDIPFDVPDLALTSLDVTEIEDGLQVATTLATSEGNAQLQADVNLTPLTINGQIVRADARLARPWFEGINAGTLSGDVTVIEDDIRADMRLDGGEVVLPAGGQTLVLDNIQGPVTFADNVATTTLTSDVLGGRLELTANADLTQEQWQANAQLATDLTEVGELANIAEALSGTLTLQAEASGWEQVQANLNLNGTGEAFGESINTLSGNARFDSSVTDGIGLNASLTAELDGASVRADVTPTLGGLEGLARVVLEDFSTDATNNLSGQLEARFQQTDTLTGGLTGDLTGGVAGRQLNLNLNADVLDDVTDGFGLRALLNADTNLGEQLSGDVTLRGSDIVGRLELTSLTAPGLTSPVNATLTTDGTLDDLPFTLQVDGVQVPSVANNFDGQLSGRWQAGVVNDINAELGPLNLSGQVSLADGGVLEVNLTPTALAAPLSGQVTVTNGEVNLTPLASGWQVTTTAQLQTENINTATVSLSNLQANVRAEVGGELRVSVIDEHVSARINGTRVDATLDDYALTLSGTPVLASGEVTTSLEDILANLQTDLRVESVRDDLTSPGLRASVRGPAEALVVDVSADAGIQAGGITLARSAALSGTVNAQTQAADLRGFVGGVNVDITSQVNGSTRNVDATLSSLGETFNVEADILGTQLNRWQTTGTLPLNPLADALSLENLSGQVAGDLGYSAGNYEGGLELDLNLNDQAVSGSLTGQGEALQVNATSIVADLPIGLAGQLTGPVTSAQLNADINLADFGTVNVSGTPANLQFQGEGTLPGVAAAGLDTQPWTLTGSLQDGINATVGNSNVQLSQLDGLDVAANIRQPVRVQDLTVTPDIDVQFNSATAVSELSGQILLASPTQTASLPVSGTLDSLQVGGQVPLDLLTDAFGADVPADLSGESLELSLFADVLGTPSYRAVALWQDVRVEADGTGSDLTASLQADDLQATFTQTSSGSQLTVNADAANLGDIVPGLPLTAVVDGDLDYDLDMRRWQGELGITTRSPVTADVTLRGVGSQLELDLSATQDPLVLDVSGNLLPRLRLNVTADTADDPLTASPVRFDGTVLGSLGSPQLEGLLVTSSFRQTEPVSVDIPPQRIGIDAGLAEAGPYLELSNTSLVTTNDDTLQLRNGQWSGTLSLPFELADAAHTLALRAEGALASPQLTANLSGEVVSGEVMAMAEAIRADLQLEPTSLDILPDAVNVQPVNLQATFTPSTGNYTATLAGSGNYATDAVSLPFSTQLNADGNGATYALQGDVIAAGEVVPLSLQGERANLMGTVNLNNLELAAFSDIVPNLTGIADGLINVAVQDGDIQLDADVQAIGSAAGQAFDVDVRAGLAEGLDVQGEVAGVQIGLRGPLAAAGTFTLAAMGEPFDVTAQVDVADTITINASGQVLEEPLQVQGQVASSLTSGNLNANIGNARLDARLTEDVLMTGRQLGVQVNVPADSFIPQDVVANAVINLNEAVVLEAFTLTSTALDLQASASGSLTPNLDVQAELVSTQLPEPLNTPITVSATTSEMGETVIQANVAETIIRASLADGVQVATEGNLELPDFGVQLENGLTWSVGTGFSGQSVVLADLSEDTRARLELTGTEGLTINGNVNAGGTSIASLNLSTSARPWQAGEDTLQGNINLAVPVGDLAPIGVVADVSVDGPLTSPQLAGNVQVLDDVGILAEGDVTASLEGANLTLTGDGITLSAQADTTGFTGDATLRAFDLSELVPQLVSPRASGRVQAQQAWGDAFVVDGNVQLETPQSEVVVVLEPTPSGYTITSQVDVNTADVTVSDLRGRVQGDLQLTPRSLTGDAVLSAPLTGNLNVRELAAATSDWFFDGQVTAAGTVRDPSANLNLTGRGSASGQLTGGVDVRGLRLQSTVAIDDVAGETVVSDLQLAISPDLQLTDARGSISFGKYQLNLVDVSPRELQLTGDGVLVGWQSLINIQDQTLSVQGDVSTLTDAASGQVDVQVNAQADAWLAGTLTNIAASGVELGDVNVLGTGGLGGQVAMRGENVDAVASLSDLSWQLERLLLRLPADLMASLQGQGQGANADITASLAGELTGEAFDIPLRASYQQGDARVVVASTPLFGGEVDVDLNLSEGTLAGNLNLADVTLAGARLNVAADVAGTLTSPEASLTLDVMQGDNQLTGEASFVNGALELDSTLASALLDEPLQLSGQVLPEVNLQASQAGERLQIQVDSGRISSQGELALELAGVVLELTGSPSAASSLELRADASNIAPGLAFQTRLPQTLSDVDSITLIGLDGTAGAIRVDVANRAVNFDELNWQAPEDLAELPASVSVTGSVQQTDTGLQGHLSGEYQSGRDTQADPVADVSQPVETDVTGNAQQPEPATLRQPSQRPLPWLADFERVPFVLTLDGQQVNLAVPSNLGDVNADISLAPLSLAVQGDLRLAEGRAQVDVRYDQEQGPAGSVVLERVPLLISPAQVAPNDIAPDPSADPITNLPVTTLAVTSTVNLQPSGLDLRGNLQVFEGQVGLQAQAGWSQVLPSGLATSYFPASGDELSAELLLDNFNPQVVPQVAARIPNLTAPISGAVSIRENLLLGQLVSPRLAVFDSNLPLTLELSGTLDAPVIQGTIGRNRLTASVTDGQLTGRLNLAQFPLHSLAEAVIGDLDLDARTTAAIRFGLPLADAANGLVVDVATERVRFLQAGEVVSTGDVSLLYEDGALTIRRARFDSVSEDDIDAIRGFWEAQGNVTPDVLDVQLVAQDADFTPILQLLPNLAALELDVRGSLALITSGSLTDPTVSLTSPLVTVGLGESVYRVEDTDVSIANGNLAANSRIDAGAPLAGSLLISGGGNLTEDVTVQLTGDLELPPLGLVDNIDITVVPTQEGVPVTGSVRLGNPLNVTGTLAPVSLDLSGQDLDINAPAFTLASSITDITVGINQMTRADLDPPSDPAGQVVYVISGQIFTEQAQLETAPADSDAPPPNRADTPPTPNPFLEQVIFDDLRILAPQRVNFQQNVITAEARIDLTLAGTAAEPTLSGRAETIRGNVRFSGRDFSLSEAAAIFEPSRGALPRLDVDAQTTYQKQDVLSGNAEDVIIEPRGSSFTVFLAIDGELNQTDAGIPSLQLEPTLTSNAQVLVSGVERPLTDQEIITLLTLGRLELSDNPLDAGGLAGSMANTALDTAVDTFLLAQLQSALSEALNVDLFEIRTSSVSSLVAGDDDPFGVSVRLGTYIADNLFASFRVGSFDDPNQAFALSNEFSLRYDFAPFFVEFSGGVNFPSDPTLSPVPVFDVAFNYAVNRSLSVQTGLGYTSEGAVTDVSLRFGVDYRF